MYSYLKYQLNRSGTSLTGSVGLVMVRGWTDQLLPSACRGRETNSPVIGNPRLWREMDLRVDSRVGREHEHGNTLQGCGCDLRLPCAVCDSACFRA